LSKDPIVKLKKQNNINESIC